MLIHYTYKQRAIIECSGNLKIPDTVADKGEAAIYEYIRENEPYATGADIEVVDFLDEVDDTMDFEEEP